MSKQQGRKCKVWIKNDLNTDIVLAAQKGASLSRSTDTLDASSKDSDWKDNEAGLKGWSIECDGLLIESDAAYLELEDKWLNGEKVAVSIIMASGSKFEGEATITDFPVDMGFDDFVTYSVSFEGKGALTRTPAV